MFVITQNIMKHPVLLACSDILHYMNNY